MKHFSDENLEIPTYELEIFDSGNYLLQDQERVVVRFFKEDNSVLEKRYTKNSGMETFIQDGQIKYKTSVPTDDGILNIFGWNAHYEGVFPEIIAGMKKALQS